MVAQNMHETLLEAMKALSEEFRQRSKSQSNSGPGGGATASNPISVPSRRHHANPPPSQVGFTRRPRTEPPGGSNCAAGVNSASASPTPRHSFPRSRTASDGGKIEEGMAGALPLHGPSSSPSTNGSCSTTPILRSKSARGAPTTAAKTPLGLMRSISTPAPSPAPSLSSSSGHGSEFGGITSSSSVGPSTTYSRVPSHHASVSGSPSDYGSSDEYGSSPGDHTLLPSPGLPGSSAGSAGSQSLNEEGANYILMGQRSNNSSVGSNNQGTMTSTSLPAQGTPTYGSQPQNRRVLRRSSSRECETERRLLSKRASLPPMALERLAPRQRRAEEPADEDSADYAVMSRSTSRESFASTSSGTQREAAVGAALPGGGGGGYLDVAGELRNDRSGGTNSSVEIGVDNGYMSMLPGVTQPPVSLPQSLAVSVPDSDSKPADDYMAMTPNNSVSPPQQIRPPPPSDGYMIMSPNSSCSPDQRGSLAGGAWVGSGSADSRAGSDYMNMSPISARSVNGSPPPDHSSHLETSSQQQAPKMVYSYYSLPRSYKHNPSGGHFDDGPGRGRRPNGSCRGKGGGRIVGGRQEHSAAGNSVVGHHLSLSSSSYSSSSASNESLGENEERTAQAACTAPGGAQPKDSSKLQQPRGSGGFSKRSHPRSRPVSLFVDVSKANTLPRVRENPLPPEPKSPGEYVSIEFKGEKCNQTSVRGCGRGLRHGLSFPIGPSAKEPQQRPTSCLGNFMPISCSPSAPIHPSAASEYVNMDLGPSPSPSPLSVTPLVFPSFHTPPTPPTLAHAPKVCDETSTGLCQEEEAQAPEAPFRKSRGSIPSVTESESPTSCGDYTEMAFGLNSNMAPRSSSSVSPKGPSPTRADASVSVLSQGIDFPLTKTGPNPDHGAKVIRADPQARRRHCSETFLASPSLQTATSSASSSTASLFPEHAQAVARRLGFETMLWGNGAVADNPTQFIPPGQQLPPTNTQTVSTEQGLNYIDLDLANKESPHFDLDGSTGIQGASRLLSVLAGGSGVGGINAGIGNSSGSNGSSLNTYASIDFYKSEELRTHQNGSKEGKGKTFHSSYFFPF